MCDVTGERLNSAATVKLSATTADTITSRSLTTIHALQRMRKTTMTV